MMLPTPATRASLRAFWVFLSLVAGAFTTLALRVGGVSGGRGRAFRGTAVAVGFAAPGLARPHAVGVPYRAWNWLARQGSTRMIRYVTAVAFYTVTQAVSRSDEARVFEAASAAPSMWKPRKTQSPEAYRSQYHDPLVGGEQDGWATPVRQWMQASDHRQALTLLPFLKLIRALDTEPDQRETAAPDIYTLY